MATDINPYFLIYLLGCSLVICLFLVRFILFTMLDWFTKANILAKNVKKISIPDKKPIYRKILEVVGMFILETLLSWVNVFVLSWQIISGIFGVLREMLNPVPEEIKVLRYPLRNNPFLDKETVWAHIVALDVKYNGKQPEKYFYEETMNELSKSYPTFDFTTALNKLESMNALTRDSIAMLRSIADDIGKEESNVPNEHSISTCPEE